MKKSILGLLFVASSFSSHQTLAQRLLMDMVDTTNQMGKGMLSIYHRYNRLRVSGYIQPQFQFVSGKGAESYSGGNFSELSNNRFMLRRGRFRLDYAHLNEKEETTSYFVFQFDGTERGVAIRDFWGRIYENKFKLFYFTTGMFARPFGHEVNLSSANRESPERGRMSQILMKTERDIGFMVSVNDRRKGSRFGDLKLDLGIFNGQGMAGPVDYDSHKDLIGRLTLTPTKIIPRSGVKLSAGISGYLGGITSQSAVMYRTVRNQNQYVVRRDSSARNYLRAAPRKYAGADFQLVFPNRNGTTEFRAEYMFGQQSAMALSSETPGTYPVSNGSKAPLYVRNFDGAYFYFIQSLGSKDHQLLLKYDWYDPNNRVSGKQIAAADGFTKADLRYDSFGGGYVYYANPTLKFTVFYDFVRNEKSGLPAYLNDVSDDVLTCRVQYSF
jgi:hypothetical protein